MRHLTERQAAAALRRGAAIEQMLSTSLDAGARPGRWVNAGVVQDEYADLRSADPPGTAAGGDPRRRRRPRLVTTYPGGNRGSGGARRDPFPGR
ncbi:hypothetical protein HDA36_002085 [Nocardiopsis composta]|uniref:Uncharacterized protein n=1 Tax=Nocardiopsis composta TaxID=157465 RepID=A0A7W8QKE7_9ACTN|nr:hypothetical protein [Nocardiopsis composta]